MRFLGDGRSEQDVSLLNSPPLMNEPPRPTTSPPLVPARGITRGRKLPPLPDGSSGGVGEDFDERDLGVETDEDDGPPVSPMPRTLNRGDTFAPIPLRSSQYPEGFSLTESFSPDRKTSLTPFSTAKLVPLPSKKPTSTPSSPTTATPPPRPVSPTSTNDTYERSRGWSSGVLRRASRTNSTKHDMLMKPVVADHEEWVVERPSIQLENPILTEIHHPYAEEYGDVAPHMNFVVYFKDQAKSIISVKRTPEAHFPQTQKTFNLGPSYAALNTLEAESEHFDLHNVPIAKVGSALGESFAEFLTARLRDPDWRVQLVEERKFVKELLALEAKHTRKLDAFKCAVLYAKSGQTDMKEIFANKPDQSSPFWRFMDSIGHRVKVGKEAGWDQYRGDMGSTGEDADTPTYYTRWYQKQVIFHMAPYMSSEQHRRLCGNDIAVVIFYDDLGTGKPFVPFGSVAMGTVPHIFLVVQEHPSAAGFYRIACFKRPSVHDFTPACPPHTHFFSSSSLKSYLLTKLHNGYIKAQACPPMDRLFKVPRAAAIKSLGEEYIITKEKNKQPVSPRTAAKKGLSESGSLLVSLECKVGSGRNLASKDKNGLSDPYLEIFAPQEQKFKTKTIKKTLNPHWNQTFEITNLHDEDEIIVVCWDANANGRSDYMGEFALLAKNIQKNTICWHDLYSSNGDVVKGQIELYFTPVDVAKREQREAARKLKKDKSKAEQKKIKEERKKAIAEQLLQVGF